MQTIFVQFRYSDGFTKYCSEKEALLLAKMGRGEIVRAPVFSEPAEKPAPAPDAKPVRARKTAQKAAAEFM